jgi:hypothetical protein
MEDSLKGLLITATIIGLFFTCIINFIVLFPQEQGVVFTGQQQNNYLTMVSNNGNGTQQQLNTLNNQSGSAFEQWDVTQGFMGSNQVKQGQGGLLTMITSIFTNLGIVSSVLFANSPAIVYTLGILTTLSIAYFGYALYKFVRTGN